MSQSQGDLRLQYQHTLSPFSHHLEITTLYMLESFFPCYHSDVYIRFVFNHRQTIGGVDYFVRVMHIFIFRASASCSIRRAWECIICTYAFFRTRTVLIWNCRAFGPESWSNIIIWKRRKSMDNRQYGYYPRAKRSDNTVIRVKSGENIALLKLNFGPGLGRRRKGSLTRAHCGSCGFCGRARARCWLLLASSPISTESHPCMDPHKAWRSSFALDLQVEAFRHVTQDIRPRGWFIRKTT